MSDCLRREQLQRSGQVVHSGSRQCAAHEPGNLQFRGDQALIPRQARQVRNSQCGAAAAATLLSRIHGVPPPLPRLCTTSTRRRAAECATASTPVRNVDSAQLSAPPL
eukprot:350789-Chlamydomonas_euryale.AAC.2